MLTTIIPYISPSNLIPFFLTHNFPFSTKFTYDASVPIFEDHEDIKHIINTFPNLILKGIRIHRREDIIQSHLHQLRYIIAHGSSISQDDIYLLQKCTKLESLTLSYCTNIHNLSFPLHYPHLTSINIEGCNVDNILGLQYYTKLRYVNIGLTRITDVSPLSSSSSNLRTLTAFNSPINTLNPISNLKKITFINISRSAITDLSVFSNYKKLKTLNISDSNISNLSPLSHCKCLRNLIIIKCKNIFTLAPFSHHPSIEVIMMSSCPNIHDITPLSTCPKLHSLWLHKCSKSLDDSIFLKTHGPNIVCVFKS